MNVRLPDMSGPPVWWDALVLVTTLASVTAVVVRHRTRHRTRSLTGLTQPRRRTA